MAGEFYTSRAGVGPVCRCGRCVLYTDRDRSRQNVSAIGCATRPVLIVSTVVSWICVLSDNIASLHLTLHAGFAMALTDPLQVQ